MIFFMLTNVLNKKLNLELHLTLLIYLKKRDKNLDDFDLVYFKICEFATQGSKEITVEYTLQANATDFLSIDKLNKEQMFAFNVIMESIITKTLKVCFIDGPGETGKTFYIDVY